MKYIRLFEKKLKNPKFEVGDYVNFINDTTTPYIIKDIDQNTIYSYCIYDEYDNYIGWFKEEVITMAEFAKDANKYNL